jgi:hypothetical protein
LTALARATPLPALRQAPFVMSPARAGAVVPNALSFSRTALRELVRGRWRIDKLRFELDAEGRGEILYRFGDGQWVFHFFLISTCLPEAQKMDRNWAQYWDAMGVLCEGAWTPEREALLRVEVPKQRAGYADYDTLVYARGNRSGRLFDHVVDSLAAGRQPDLARIAGVGYILRTTAFIGNGQLGTRSYAGFAPDHPLRRPYHAQMCSGFLLREYVFDLVDHMARARNPDAVRLDPAFRRYLGLGNAAATGLVAFAVNHPHWLHRWTLANETAIAQALRRKPSPGDLDRLRHLLDRAIRYFEEGSGVRSDRFATAHRVADDLARVRARVGPVVGDSWRWAELADWATDHVGLEAGEVLNALLLELYDDIVAAAIDSFDAPEHFDTEPAMRVADLRALLRSRYAWALGAAFSEATQKFFWFRGVATPRDVRRGLRGLAPELEHENGMDTVVKLRELDRALAARDASASAADLLCDRPDLRHIVARVQSLAALDYAELRINWGAADFSPYEPVRFVLACFGMDKLEATPPKQVRGAFMQGAPIAEDVACGRDGDWPFPLIPAAGTLPVELAPLPAPGLGACRRHPEVPPREWLRIAPHDLARTLQIALQAHGATLGVASQSAAMVVFSQALGQDAVGVVLAQCAAGLDPAGSRGRLAGCGLIRDARGAAALLVAPAALDLACARAFHGRDGAALVVVENAAHATMLEHLALRCAERGMRGAVAWCGTDGVTLAVAGSCPPGQWFEMDGMQPDQAQARLVALFGESVRGAIDAIDARPGRFCVACARPAGSPTHGPTARGTSSWSAAALDERRRAWEREGIVIRASTLAALERAAAACYVPVADLQRLRPGEDTDALKVF